LKEEQLLAYLSRLSEGCKLPPPVLDYRDEDVVARIRKLAPDLEYAFDTLGPSSNSLIVHIDT
jgi:hypothetical protein